MCPALGLKMVLGPSCQALACIGGNTWHDLHEGTEGFRAQRVISKAIEDGMELAIMRLCCAMCSRERDPQWRQLKAIRWYLSHAAQRKGCEPNDKAFATASDDVVPTPALGWDHQLLRAAAKLGCLHTVGARLEQSQAREVS